MGLGVEHLSCAVGAILAFAVEDNVSGVNIHTVGWILMIVGILGIVLSMIFWSSWAGPGYFSGRRRTTDRRRRPRRASRVLSSWRLRAARGGQAALYVAATGSSTVKVEPRRPSEATQIRPCMRCTSSREM